MRKMEVTERDIAIHSFESDTQEEGEEREEEDEFCLATEEPELARLSRFVPSFVL